VKKIVILTGSDLRHDFFRIFLSNQDGIEVIRSYAESKDGDLDSYVESRQEQNELRKTHLLARNQSEEDFFGIYLEHAVDYSNPQMIARNSINSEEYVDSIGEIGPDLIVSYGCSIVKSELLDQYKDRFINVHLGLSPYYRGGGTNFWPFVNGELQYLGVTFMHINRGVDTGEVIHQIRPEIFPMDNIHSIGNRLIIKAARSMGELVRNFDRLFRPEQIRIEKNKAKYYKKADFTESALELAYKNLNNGLVGNYLHKKDELDGSVPITVNDVFSFRDK